MYACQWIRLFDALYFHIAFLSYHIASWQKQKRSIQLHVFSRGLCMIQKQALAWFSSRKEISRTLNLQE